MPKSAPPETDADRLVAAEMAAYRLLLKFHKETICGRPYHWAECEALVDAFGWASWEVWVKVNSNLGVTYAPHR
jgi:hypothetical protein